MVDGLTYVYVSWLSDGLILVWFIDSHGWPFDSDICLVYVLNIFTKLIDIACSVDYRDEYSLLN